MHRRIIGYSFLGLVISSRVTYMPQVKKLTQRSSRCVIISAECFNGLSVGPRVPCGEAVHQHFVKS